jgi:hypothetical protein
MSNAADPNGFLTSTCKESLAALQVAAASGSTLRNFDTNAPENARVDQAFSAARTKIQDCFSHFGVCIPLLRPIRARLIILWRTVGIALGPIRENFPASRGER